MNTLNEKRIDSLNVALLCTLSSYNNSVMDKVYSVCASFICSSHGAKTKVRSSQHFHRCELSTALRNIARSIYGINICVDGVDYTLVINRALELCVVNGETLVSIESAFNSTSFAEYVSYETFTLNEAEYINRISDSPH